jgi:hypothetical protein
MGYPSLADMIIIDFDPHVLSALMCLAFAIMIVLIRVLIDQADHRQSDHRR